MKTELANYLNKETDLLKLRQKMERAKLDCPLCDVIMGYSDGAFCCPICFSVFYIPATDDKQKQKYISGRLMEKIDSKS
jgi:uncharacterized Zn finger protein (UPF0148 family)